MEDIAEALQALPDFLIVFDDAIVHQGQPPVIAALGVGIAFRRLAVRGPAGMPHGRGGQGHGFVRRVIPSIFQTTQSFHHHGNTGTMTGIADDAAHSFLLDDMKGRTPPCAWQKALLPL